ARREGRPPEVAPPASAGTLIGRWWPFAMIGVMAVAAILLNITRRPPQPAGDPSKVPAPPTKSVAAWSLDVLLWGGFAVILIAAFNRVDLPNIVNLFSNSQNMREYGRDFLNPEFSNW